MEREVGPGAVIVLQVTGGDAPCILGNWVVVQVNGLPSKVASSIVTIGQRDPTRTTRVYPFGEDVPTGMSWAPPKSAVDVENSMVFSADQGMMKIGGVRAASRDRGDDDRVDPRRGDERPAGALRSADRRVLGTA